MKKLLILCSLILFTTLAQAQFMTFTATVQDASGQNITNGAYSFNYIDPVNSNGVIANISGVAIQKLYNGVLDTGGVLSQSIEDLTLIQPTGGKWGK